ncbi:MAG TPA: hypothetical protein VI451_21685 [Anaerolineales bacterium]|jgi:hypothetical protein|nr:hypothetical protein [Anaerolineales bacterium]
MEDTLSARARNFSTHGWFGLALIGIFWPLNWALTPAIPFTAYGFFPLWVGYCLTVDALAAFFHGTSLLTRGGRKYTGLFLISVPIWWVFEILNWRIQNWHYAGRELFTDLEYLILSSLSFSTVLPAVLGTAELLSGMGFLRQAGKWLMLPPTPRVTRSFALAGVGMFLAVVIWPRAFFPFVWISLYCILEPVNIWLGHRSLAECTRHGDWRPVWALFLGVLICGFFWEMWNYFSYPKWVYTVAWGGFAHIFEMPLLGYGGYLPFALELFAVYHFVMGLLGEKKTDYITKGLFREA